MASTAFQSWLDDFFAAYYRRRPVNGTFIGMHAEDARLPDVSMQGLDETASEMETLQRRLAALPDEVRTPGQEIDHVLAAGFLQIQQWELQSHHFQRGNPSYYTGEAAFGLLSLLRRPFAPVEERLEAAAERMAALPAFLEHAQANVAAAPRGWTDKAINECDGLLHLVGQGLDLFFQANHPANPQRWADVRRQVQRAVTDYQHFLMTELRHNATADYACGEEAFDLLLKRGYGLDETADEIAGLAREQMSVNAAYLQEHAKDFGAATPEGALAQLVSLHPSTEHYYARYGELWEACRAMSERHALVTWPDTPVDYVPRPAWVRAAAPHLYFLFYHAPAPFDRLPRLEYLVTPIDLEHSEAEQAMLLGANNESVIKLNHVVHHGALGHHVQNLHAMQARSRIGQVAAVDCASRIAMFCGGQMAEGWACYATDLMDEVGFLTPLEHYSQSHSRLRMAARALVDVELHHGRQTLDQAAVFYQEQVGMTAGAAQAEAVKNSMFPGTGLMYLTGTEAIHRLRREQAQRSGFNLRAFHDELLSWGSIPISVAARAMRKEPI